MEIIFEFMNSDDFQTKDELTKVLSVVKDEDPTLLEKIYETMTTSQWILDILICFGRFQSVLDPV